MKNKFLFRSTALVLTVILLTVMTGVFSSCDRTGEKESVKKLFVFDTDVGTDDAVAIMLLAKKEGILPDYIVATHGNASAEQSVKNAIILTHYLECTQATVVAGMKPEIEDNGEKNTFHGKDGLANISEKTAEKCNLKESDYNDYMQFDDFCNELLKAEEITYIAVGPVTNLAYLVKNDDIRSKIKTVYLMGGGIKEFNCSHNTEFNFSKNPEAVREVLNSGLDITLFPLDLTNSQYLNEKEIDALESFGNYEEYITFLRFCLNSNVEYNGTKEAVLHDCMPVLYYANPEKYTISSMKLVSDEYGALRESDDGINIKVATKVEDGFLKSELTDIFSNLK